MRLHALQYLRAVAALIVVYSHACIQVPAYQPYLMKFGSFGVDIFFVISGFIMMYIAKPDAKPGAFFMNRIRRVVPLYWFFTLLMAGLLLTMPSVFAKAEFNLLQTIQSLFFIPHFSSAHPGEIWPIVPPGWSLIYEMYFYALFGLSLYFAPKSRLALIALVITTVYFAAKVFDTAGPFNYHERHPGNHGRRRYTVYKSTGKPLRRTTRRCVIRLVSVSFVHSGYSACHSATGTR